MPLLGKMQPRFLQLFTNVCPEGIVTTVLAWNNLDFDFIAAMCRQEREGDLRRQQKCAVGGYGRSLWMWMDFGALLLQQRRTCRAMASPEAVGARSPPTCVPCVLGAGRRLQDEAGFSVIRDTSSALACCSLPPRLTVPVTFSWAEPLAAIWQQCWLSLHLLVGFPVIAARHAPHPILCCAAF